MKGKSNLTLRSQVFYIIGFFFVFRGHLIKLLKEQSSESEKFYAELERITHLIRSIPLPSDDSVRTNSISGFSQPLPLKSVISVEVFDKKEPLLSVCQKQTKAGGQRS